MKCNQNNISLFHNGREHIIRTQMINACDKLTQNRNVSNDISKELSMTEAACTQSETKSDAYKIIVEFPERSEGDENIYNEIKLQLRNLLQEQLAKNM